jgi:predicted enzyme related to lactoylglutathione lyase
MTSSRILRARLSAFALALIALSNLTQSAVAQTTVQPASVVFFDIAGQDTAALRLFYNKVFGWSIGAEENLASPFTVVVTPQLQGILRKEDASKVPPNEVLLYLGVADITVTLASVVANGGSVVYPRIEVPGAVVMGLFKDPAGNRFGLIEMEGGKAKVPASGD